MESTHVVHPETLPTKTPPATTRQQYSLAALAHEPCWTGAGSRRSLAEPSILAAELQTVVYFLPAVLAHVSRLALAAVVGQQVHAGPIDAGHRGALVGLPLTQFPLPARAAAAVKAVELVVADALVEAGLGLAHRIAAATLGRLVASHSPGEAGGLGAVRPVQQWQVHPPDPHLSQAAREVLRQPHLAVVKEVEVPAHALAAGPGPVPLPVHTEVPGRGRPVRVGHGQVDVVPGAIWHGGLTGEGQELRAGGAVQLHQQVGVEHGEAEDLGVVPGAEHHGVAVPRAEWHFNAGDRVGQRVVGAVEQCVVLEGGFAQAWGGEGGGIWVKWNFSR